jgi:hypothetical protein
LSQLKRLRSRIALRLSPFFPEMIDRAQHLVEQIVQEEGALLVAAGSRRGVLNRHIGGGNHLQ